MWITTAGGGWFRVSCLYTPALDFFGVETFNYTIGDGLGHTDTAMVRVTVTDVNDNPAAVDDNLVVREASIENLLAVLENDSSNPDPPESLIVTAFTSLDAAGDVRIAPGGRALVYTPKTNFLGVETFSYQVADGNGGTSWATVQIRVASNWVNVVEPKDVDEDGYVAALDVLLVIDYLNNVGTGPLPKILPTPGRPFVDSDGDGIAAPIDALIIINYLNNPPSAEGEDTVDYFHAFRLQTLVPSPLAKETPTIATMVTGRSLPDWQVTTADLPVSVSNVERTRLQDRVPTDVPETLTSTVGKRKGSASFTELEFSALDELFATLGRRDECSQIAACSPWGIGPTGWE